MSHLNRHNLFNSFQSAYQPGHSSETALLKVVNDLLLAVGEGKLSVLVLLHISAAFDTIDHDILLHRQHIFSIQGIVLTWFQILSHLKISYCFNSWYSFWPNRFCCGIPHGSVVGPILFILYTQPLTSVILKHPVSHMLYADDTQVYKSFDLNDCLSSILCVESV